MDDKITIKRSMGYVFACMCVLLACLIRIYAVTKPTKSLLIANIVLGLSAFACLLRCLIVRNYIVLSDGVLKINEIVSFRKIEISSIQSVSMKKLFFYPATSIRIITTGGKKYRIDGSEGERDFEMLYKTLVLMINTRKALNVEDDK